MASVYDTLMEPGVGIMSEFDAAEKLTTTYCRPLTEDEYEDQAASETERALKELIAYMECHPEQYAEVLRRKKVDDMENAGLFSFLKVKAMQLIQGELYPTSLAQSSDCHHQLNHLKRDMMKAFEYSQDAKGRRCSKRLALKQKNTQVEANKAPATPPALKKKTRMSPRGKENESPHATRSKTPVAKIHPCSPSRRQAAPPVPPPPPPPPAPPLLPSSALENSVLAETSLEEANSSANAVPPQQATNNQSSDGDTEQTEFITPPEQPRVQGRRTFRKRSSSSSLNPASQGSALHTELQSSRPLQRLRTTEVSRSPGGTPRRLKRELSEPLHAALITAFKNKFQNFRSPNSSRDTAGSAENSFYTSPPSGN